MLIEKISSDEQKIIEIMRHSCGEDDSDFFTGEYVSNNEFLRFWESEKRSIFEAFGNQLILKKRVCSTIEDDLLYDNMRKILWSPEGERFRDALFEDLDKANPAAWCHDYLHCDGYRNGTTSMFRVVKDFFFNTDDWIDNRYKGCDFEMNLPNGSTLKIVHGCKLMKMLGRIVKGCNNSAMANDFEYVRLRQSQIMNEANITADLCLSIHPLDYMTASYNENDWRSCMCWEDGEYRRGVIEMMNSPLVVVAYISSGSEQMTWGQGYNEPTLKWNSKRWREFFIVTDDLISGIKGYPYWNRDLEDKTLDWLRQIFINSAEYSDKITKWKYTGYSHNYIKSEDSDDEIRLRFSCGPAMYNDFYNENEYHTIFAKALKDDIYINYSGVSECVCCGSTDDYIFDGEGSLICTNCMEAVYCAKCGERIMSQYDRIEHNGLTYCRYCYENLDQCDSCGEPIDPDNDEEVFTFCVGRDEDTENDVLRQIPTQGEFSFRNKTSIILTTICGDCAKSFFVKGIDEIYAEHKDYKEWYHYYPIVPIDRLTEEGLSHFEKEDIEYFKAKKSYEIASA